MSWGERLLSGDLAERALETIDSIASALLQTDPSSIGDCSLASGAAGLALFHEYYARHAGAAAHRQHADRLMDRCAELLAQRPLAPGLFGGFTGVAWTFEVLGAADEDFLDAVDTALMESTSTRPYKAEYDLIAGLAGIGIFAAARCRHDSGIRLLAQVVDRLLETASSASDGITWEWDLRWTPETLRSCRRPGGYDIGVAHGISGVIPVLAAAWVLLGDPRALAACRGACRWLLGQRLEREHVTYPGIVWPGRASSPTRSAWCYGDPGVAAALSCAADWLNDTVLAEHARDVAVRALGRPIAEWDLKDAGLCHGTAGVAHTYHRLFRATGDESLRLAAESLFDKTITMRVSPLGTAGYRNRAEVDPPPRGADLGVLEGAAGIGLALLTALDVSEPLWDAAFALGLRRLANATPATFASPSPNN